MCKQITKSVRLSLWWKYRGKLNLNATLSTSTLHSNQVDINKTFCYMFTSFVTVSAILLLLFSVMLNCLFHPISFCGCCYAVGSWLNGCWGSCSMCACFLSFYFFFFPVLASRRFPNTIFSLIILLLWRLIVLSFTWARNAFTLSVSCCSATRVLNHHDQQKIEGRKIQASSQCAQCRWKNWKHFMQIFYGNLTKKKKI